MVFKSFLSKAKDIDILAAIPDGVLLIDENGKIEWINDVAALLLDMPKSDALKRNINDIMDGGIELAKQAALHFKSVVGRTRNKENKDIFLEIMAKPIENFIVISLRDVTQSYKTVTNIMVEQESSKKINKDKNVFLVKLSNELKSPIHSVMGFSQAMIDGLGGEMSEKQEKYIKIINKNSNDVLYFIEKILELSKTESNLFEYEFQIFDAINSMQSVLKNFEQRIKDKSLNLNFDMTDLIKKAIFSDENAFKTIFQNILETSINSTDIGSINIKAYHPEPEYVADQGIEIPEEASDKSYMMLTITDTGAGISEADLDVIFEPYAMLDRPNKKSVVRSIALSSARNLVKYLKGAIWIESEPMQGTTYNLILPIEK